MDKEYVHMSISIAKALNSSETPLKMKHARNVIIATHRLKEAKSLWKQLTRQRLMEHRFTAWKFCHLLHKLMREGEPSVLKQSLTHKTLILEVGKLWGHLQDGFGPCIESYSKLLVYKLEFHEKNGIFPGSLSLDFFDIDKFVAGDINVHFQMCVEIFDYLDHIIELQSKIITSFNSFRMTSMTPQGQCRLAPLITLIQDSNPLYDTCVRIMFKLHNNLTGDTLSGHRDRFSDIFSKLKYIYDKVRPLQYFADVVQFPTLPENAPNFLSQVELGSYKTPIMFVKQEVELSTGPLMDDVVPPQTSQNDKADDSYEIIKRLQEELIEKENQIKNEASLVDKISQLAIAKQILESEIVKIQEKLHKASEQNEILQRQLIEIAKLDDKIKESEESAKSYEEKFKKIKLMYAKLRDEHVNLLRLHGDNKRCLDSEKKTNNELKSNLEDLYIKIRYLESNQQGKMNEYEQRLTDKSDEITRLQDEIKKSQANFKELKKQFDAALSEYNMKLQNEIEINQKMSADANVKQNEYQKCSRIFSEFQEKLKNYQEEITDLNTKMDEVNETLKIANVTIEILEQRLQATKIDVDKFKENDITSRNQLMQHTEETKTIFESIKLYAVDALKDFDYSIGNILKHNEKLQQLFQKLYTDHAAYSNDSCSINALVTTYMQLTIIVTKFHGQIIFITNNCNDLHRAQELLNKYKQFRNTMTCINGLLVKEGTVSDLKQMLDTVLNELQVINQILLLLRDALNEEFNVGDMLQEELKIMDKIIEEATLKILEIYSDAKLKHNGIQLELNEKILDSCTTLMHAIKVLIQKSRLLQQEIVSQGKGNFPTKEFYKRNSQWTEGLLSASKNIAKGANFLVEAANKFFNSESTNNFEIIVAAQEIAASTTQLVIASKVKADKNSHKLADLTKASRDVSQATGSVVAAVEGKSIYLNNMDDFDISKLTSSQMKAKEMEIHVKVLELEKALQNERYKLSSFRKACYRNSDEFENC